MILFAKRTCESLSDTLEHTQEIKKKSEAHEHEKAKQSSPDYRMSGGGRISRRARQCTVWDVSWHDKDELRVCNMAEVTGRSFFVEELIQFTTDE